MLLKVALQCTTGPAPGSLESFPTGIPIDQLFQFLSAFEKQKDVQSLTL